MLGRAEGGGLLPKARRPAALHLEAVAVSVPVEAQAGLVAQRLERFTSIFGPDRVMAGSDCGFGTFAGFGAVDPDIAWAKLATLAAGARLAS